MAILHRFYCTCFNTGPLSKEFIIGLIIALKDRKVNLLAIQVNKLKGILPQIDISRKIPDMLIGIFHISNSLGYNQLGNTEVYHSEVIYSFLATCSCNFCLLLLIFANSLDPDQGQQNVSLDLDPECLTLRL